MFIVAFALIIAALAAVIVWTALGPIPGLLVLVLGVAIVFAGTTRPGKRG
jgi:uncharacterized membrane protein